MANPAGTKKIFPVRNGSRTEQREARVKEQQWEFGTEDVPTNSLNPKHCVNYIDALAESPAPATFSPTIFIGVGKMGTQVLQQLKKRIEHIMFDLFLFSCLSVIESIEDTLSK